MTKTLFVIIIGSSPSGTSNPFFSVLLAMSEVSVRGLRSEVSGVGPDVAVLKSLRCEVGGLRTEGWSVRLAVRCEV